MLYTKYSVRDNTYSILYIYMDRKSWSSSRVGYTASSIHDLLPMSCHPSEFHTGLISACTDEFVSNPQSCCTRFVYDIIFLPSPLGRGHILYSTYLAYSQCTLWHILHISFAYTPSCLYSESYTLLPMPTLVFLTNFHSTCISKSEAVVWSTVTSKRFAKKYL